MTKSSVNSLAIVIPAYKVDFLPATLESIAMQTSKDFTLYICDDNSPYDIKSVVEKYMDRLDVKYKKFTTNLGQADLVAHWKRCIEFIADEEWIWLFSDDDIMENNCVEEFYKFKKENPGTDLFRFNMIKIDENGKELDYDGKGRIFKTVDELILGRLNSTIQIAVVEFIFNRQKFNEVGGFQYFDLAWGSDDATWIKLGFDRGIKNILSANVNWRISTQNISAIVSGDITYRKMMSRIEFTKWLLEYQKTNKLTISHNTLQILAYEWVHRFLKGSIKVLSIAQIIKIESKINDIVGRGSFTKRSRIFKISLFKLNKTIKSAIKKVVFKK